jgi:hypothetical protein
MQYSWEAAVKQWRVHGRLVLVGLLGFGLAPVACAAPTARSDAAAIMERDVLGAEVAFWSAFNRCYADAMAPFFTEDAEFYHDKTGLTATRAAIVASMMTGPCGNPPGERLQREAVEGSERFAPLADGYALLSGQQRFRVASAGPHRQQDGIGSYVEIWRKTAGGWQMRRVVSYDHEAAPNAR